MLSAETGGRPERSARFRTLYAPAGLGSELRVVFSAGGACWGVACLARAEGERDFAAEEAAFVASVAGEIGYGLRAAARLETAGGAEGAAEPCMLVLGTDLSIESMTAAAERHVAPAPGRRPAGGRSPTP